MIYNYLKIAVRNLMKYKFISFINLFGLTVGLTCCLLIFTYILHELSYDKYHPNSSQVYRVTRTFNNAETGAINLELSTIAPAFAPHLLNDFGEIESMTRTLKNTSIAMKYGDKLFNETNSFFADQNFFDFFKVNVKKGNPKTALTEPFTVMLSEKIAKKYFGDEDPMNKMVRLDNNLDMKVTGIYEALPPNTHFHPELLISFITLNDTTVYGEENLRTSYGNNSFFTYIKLPKDYDPQKMIARFPAFIDKHVDMGVAFNPSKATSLGLQKLTDIHLHSHTDYEAEENGDIKRVYVFSAIALFILLIACINYMNLSTARSSLRAREIGVRKVVGAQRKEIIMQFLSESVLVSWTAMLLAFLITWALIPWMNKMSGQTLSINVLLRWEIIVPILLVPFIVGIISGIYPALYMSSFRPVVVLKGLFNKSGSNISFRKVLVTLQFAISIILIICTAIVFSQMRFMQKKSLGYDRDHIITMNNVPSLNESYETFRNDMLANTNIKELARSSRIPTGRLLDAMGSSIKNGDTLAPTNIDIKYVLADHDFIKTYGITMAAGRNFSRDYSLDTSSFLLNEAAVKALGFKNPNDILGKDFGYGGRRGKILGVFNDFHFESLHQKIVPLILFVPRNFNNYNAITVKISGNNIQPAIAHIEKVWKKFLPEAPYQYTFLDDNFERLYQAEERQRAVFTTFACLAIFIACLGLFGLSAFAISQRIKEIGIRKVLGANVSTIVTILSKDFMKLVVIAAVIAFPIAWFAMNKWLQDFAYRITIPWWIFIIAGIVAAVIALVTISFQAIKAAVANPVKSLRTE